MSDIGKGDFVEKFRDSSRGFCGVDLPMGFVGQVTEAGILSSGPNDTSFMCLKLRGVMSALPHRIGRVALLDEEMFRPIYRPKQELIESLKAPPRRVKTPSREKVST